MRRRLLVLLAGAIVVLIVVALAFYGARAEKRRLYRTMGGLLTDRAILILHWRELETNKQFAPYVTHMFSAASTPAYQTRFISVTGDDDAQKPRDSFERDFIDQFRKPESSEARSRPEFADRLLADRDAYQYYQAVRAEKNCLLICHQPPLDVAGLVPTVVDASPGKGARRLAEGDLIAIVQVTIDY